MNALRVVVFMFVVAGLATLTTPRCYAQSEIDPDHFDSPNSEPFPQPKTMAVVSSETGKIRFRGQFTLPYSLKCGAKRLLAGNYSFVLRSDGKIGWVTLNLNRQTTEIAGVVRLPADNRARNALFVERSGNTHRLSAIHVTEFDLVLDADQEIESKLGGRRRSVEKLPLRLTAPQK